MATWTYYKHTAPTISALVNWQAATKVLKTQGPVLLGPLLFIVYIKHLPRSEQAKFADDTSVTISSQHVDFYSVSNIVLSHTSKWFTANKRYNKILYCSFHALSNHTTLM